MLLLIKQTVDDNRAQECFASTGYEYRLAQLVELSGLVTNEFRILVVPAMIVALSIGEIGVCRIATDPYPLCVVT